MSTPPDNPNSPPYRVQETGDSPPSSPAYRPSSPVATAPPSPAYRPSSPVYRPSSPVDQPPPIPVATPPPIYRPQVAFNPSAAPPGKRYAGYGQWENVTPPSAAPAAAVVASAGEKKLHSANPNTIMSRKLLETYFRTVDYPFT